MTQNMLADAAIRYFVENCATRIFIAVPYDGHVFALDVPNNTAGRAIIRDLLLCKPGAAKRDPLVQADQVRYNPDKWTRRAIIDRFHLEYVGEEADIRQCGKKNIGYALEVWFKRRHPGAVQHRSNRSHTEVCDVTLSDGVTRYELKYAAGCRMGNWA